MANDDHAKLPVPEAIRRIADSEDRKLAWHFFVLFSRMEYALKRSGRYLNGTDSAAEPNWDKFGSEHNAVFDSNTSPELGEAVKYFVDQAPRKQRVSAGKLDWTDPLQYDGKGPLLTWLLLAIRCVRNNLFHGGKFPLIPISDPSRDRELIWKSMVILKAALPLSPDVKELFFAELDE